VRLTSRLGTPFRFTITADSRPSFQRSPIASPRAGAGVLIPCPAVFEMSVNLPSPLLWKQQLWFAIFDAKLQVLYLRIDMAVHQKKVGPAIIVKIKKTWCPTLGIGYWSQAPRDRSRR